MFDEFTTGRFSGRSHDAEADVTLVADRVDKINDLVQSRLAERLGIVPRSWLWSGDVGDVAVQVGQDLMLCPVVWCLPEYNSRCPADDQQGQGPIDQDDSALGGLVSAYNQPSR